MSLKPKESDDDDEDFLFHRYSHSIPSTSSNSTRRPVEHDENTENVSLLNHQVSVKKNANNVHVSEAVVKKYEQSIGETLPHFALFPELVKVHRNNNKLLCKHIGLVTYGSSELIYLFADYWNSICEDNKKRNVNSNMEVFSEGVIICKSLFVDQSRQYCYEKNYMRLSDARYQHSSTSTESVKAVGIGQYGKVYQAFDRKTKQRFAEKIVSVDRFSKNELEVLSKLNHEHIIRIFGAIRTSFGVHIFMEYADGGSVQQLLQSGIGFSGGAFSDEQLFCEIWAMTYYKQVLSALVYLHLNKLVHCDIKPSNVVLSRNKRKCFLTDFGEVRKVYNSFVTLDNIVGTQNYCSPEVIEDLKYYFKSDVWSVACFLLHMLTGNIPWTVTFPGADTFLFVITQKPFRIVEEIPSWVHNLTDSILKSSFQTVTERRSAEELLKLAEKNLILLEKFVAKKTEECSGSFEVSGLTESSLNEASEISESFQPSFLAPPSIESSNEINLTNGLSHNADDDDDDTDGFVYSSSVSPKSVSLQDLSARSSVRSNENVPTSSGLSSEQNNIPVCNGVTDQQSTINFDEESCQQLSALLDRFHTNETDDVLAEVDVLDQLNQYCNRYAGCENQV